MQADYSLFDIIQSGASVLAIAISLFAIRQTIHNEKKAERKAEIAEMERQKAEDIKLLLGEKETVGFAAVKLMHEGLPRSTEDRKLTISAIINACLFEGSDRARAVLFYVIEHNKKKYQGEFKSELEKIKLVISTMSKYVFEKKELDLSSAETRLGAVEKIINKEAT
ncbi:MAG: hypothetical protein KF862_13165 [Chitinophagaceae bacterium]|nr:hypothetical protein [Chitinophagaceae bacterium]